MNTKLCPNCNKYIEVVDNECPICHLDLTDVPIEEMPSFEQPAQENVVQSIAPQSAVVIAPVKKSKKPLIIVIISVAAVIVAVLAFLFIKNNVIFSEQEKTAVTYAKKIKNSLKSPDSLKFNNDILYIKLCDEDGEQTIYYCFDYTGANSYGVDIRSKVIFMNGVSYDPDEYDVDYITLPKGSNYPFTIDGLIEQVRKMSGTTYFKVFINEDRIIETDELVEYKVISAKKILSKL